ncbi:MAG: helix-turn-helix transcriptional regulator [Chitinophagales bacterium]|jgi:AraC-like DNA-binding protein|nr:helix-turn-helix transcriptional regulator [Chitinophagales bacterium]
MTKEIKKLRFKPSEDLQIEVISLNQLVQANIEQMKHPHRVDFYHIYLFTSCHPTHYVDFEPISVEPYSLLFIDKDRVHYFDPNQPYDGFLIIFTDEFFCTSQQDINLLRSSILFNSIVDQPTVKLEKIDFEKYANLCRHILEELNLPADKAKPIIVKNLLHNLLLLAERDKLKQGFTKVKKGADLDYTMLFRDLLETNFTKLKSVNDYAKMICISEKRLGQATAKILGKSPKEIINDRILLEAKRLLVHTHLSIKEIGQNLGFEDPAYFIRYFKKILKLPQYPLENLFQINNFPKVPY